MAVDDKDFCAAMRLLPSSVSVIATCHDGVRSALTATAVCSLAVSPARLMVCINTRGRTFDLVRKSRRLSVNFLSAEQVQEAERFAGRRGAAQDDPFAAAEWTSGITGAPLLNDTVANFDCEIDQMLMLETHAAIIARVEGLRLRRDADTLLYVNGAFTTAAAPQAAA